MTRRSRRLAPLALAALSVLAGCQDYNFSPVNQCLIQPGTERVTLSDISTADILFVVDDSGSMGGKQRSLAGSFKAFVDNLTNTNQVRVLNGLEPIDFHIAVTTTSVFTNNPPQGGATCQTGCAGAPGQVCCNSINRQPLTRPRTCKVDADCTAAGGPWTCKTTNTGLSGELTCGNAAGSPLKDPVTCPKLGQACGEIEDRYRYTHGPRSCVDTSECRAPYDVACRSGCTGAPATGTYCCDATTADPLQCNPGVSTGEYTLYPRGDFVKALDATLPAGPKPRVIHFTKDLFCTRTGDGKACACLGAGAPASCAPPVVNAAEITRLSDWFKANVAVGTCGSGQEQGLEAGRRALKKALHLDGLSQPNDVDGNPPAWPHANSKLVTVWVGDEDDCSTPEDASQGVIMTLPPVADACTTDRNLAPTDQKLYPLGDFNGFFTGLGRPLATGFIVSALANDCKDASCQSGAPATCFDPTCTAGPGLCGGQAPGVRFVALASDFSKKSPDVVVGSICHPSLVSGLPPDFSSILDRVAEVVKQPTGLSLPTQPATAGLTVLRIVGTDGKTRKTCTKPAPVGTTEVPDPITGAVLNDFDWWFIDKDDPTDPSGQKPTGASRNLQINRAVLRCVANPGETYSADYLGLVPAPNGCATVTDCEVALGVRKIPWVCEKEAGAPPGARGTCICGG